MTKEELEIFVQAVRWQMSEFLLGGSLATYTASDLIFGFTLNDSLRDVFTVPDVSASAGYMIVND